MVKWGEGEDHEGGITEAVLFLWLLSQGFSGLCLDEERAARFARTGEAVPPVYHDGRGKLQQAYGADGAVFRRLLTTVVAKSK